MSKKYEDVLIQVDEELKKHGFRELGDHEIIRDDFFKKSTEVFLKNPDLWRYKWKLINVSGILLPPHYLSNSDVIFYVDVPEEDSEPKIIFTYWNKYKTGIPKEIYFYVRKDLRYIIIRIENTPEKIAMDGTYYKSETGSICIYSVRDGEITYENYLTYDEYEYFFDNVNWEKVLEYVQESIKVTSI